MHWKPLHCILLYAISVHLTSLRFCCQGKSLSFAVLYSLSCPDVLARVQQELAALQGEVGQKETRPARLLLHPFLDSPLYTAITSEPKMQLGVVLDF